MVRRLVLGAGLALLVAGCNPPPPLVPNSSQSPVTGTNLLAATDGLASADDEASAGKADGAKQDADGRATKKPGAKLSADDLTARAIKELEGDQVKNALADLDEALALEPTHRKALMLKGVVLFSQARDAEPPKSRALYLQAADTIRKFRDSHKEKELDGDERQLVTVVLMKAAGAYAGNRKMDKAFATLDEASDTGILNEEQFQEDKDLTLIRESPRFDDFLKRAKEKAKVQAAKEVKALLAENKPFPFDFKLPDVTGKKVALADLKGKVTIVDVWGTWCPPCRMEIPHFISLYQQYHDKGLEIVGLNYENVSDKEAKTRIEEFVKDKKVPYPCLIGDDKTQEQIPSFEGFPTTLFLDREGKVRLKTVGYRPKVILEAIVERLLDEPKPDSSK